MTIKVLMLPHIDDFADPGSESGIRRVIEAYFKYLPRFDVEMLPKDSKGYDVLAVHAGCTENYGIAEPLVAITHGLYWSAMYDSPAWEYATNAKVIKSIRYAREVTVPSPWVAETFQRDMHFTPHVIPHGIEWREWQHDYQPQDYVLWNKNRKGDVCSIDPVIALASGFPDVQFISTMDAGLPNVKVTGVVPHAEMKKMVQQCRVYLSTTEETFGIGVLEAMASGRPVLGFRHGGNVDLVEHGVTGYLARPGDMEDLAEGLSYCWKHAEILGKNAQVAAKKWTWESACEKMSDVFRKATVVEPPTAAVVIPSFNYGHLVGTAIESAIGQDYDQLVDIIVVDDGSDDDGETKKVVDDIKVKAEEGLVQAQSRVNDLVGELDTLAKAIDDEESVNEPDTDHVERLRQKIASVKQTLDQDARPALRHAEHVSNRAGVLKYIRQANSGVAVARDIGIKATDAKYINCLDADDQIAPKFLSTLISHLEADQSLGLVYSGLKLLLPRGDKILELRSLWPNECDFDAQVKGQNQVPTCNVFRRKAWERLGGYRQRYAPRGCGTEDAELWLRIGAHGWGIKRATDEPLFAYLLGGRTSGDKEYREVNYLQWHPWVTDGLHPFASVATPANRSHQVRQYNKPIVSVIIPVGRGHETDIVDALDSLEAQTFRFWEAIVVDDTGDDNLDMTGFPFVRLVKTPGRTGAGYARNRGMDIARGKFSIFLDADDWFYPDALWRMLEEYREGDMDMAVYGNYDGLSIISEEEAQRARNERRLLQYRPEDGHALIRNFGTDYDWTRAVQQPDPNGNFYIWNYTPTLFPTYWHEEIGGFDERMKSWEDWDYWIRMARAGKCFVHVREPTFVYRFYTGTRRWSALPEHAEGLQLARNLVQYMRDKYAGGEVVPCTGCGGTRRRPMASDYPSLITRATANGIQTGTQVSDADFVLCEYQGQPPGNVSDHSLVGVTVFPEVLSGVPMIRRDGGWSIDYRYKKAGDRFLVHKEDLQRSPSWFRAVELEKSNFESILPKQRSSPPPPPPEPESLAETLEKAVQVPGAPSVPTAPQHAPLAAPTPVLHPDTSPEPVSEEVAIKSLMARVLTGTDLEALPGVTAGIAEQMVADGVRGYQDILNKGVDGLVKYRGVADVRATMIIDAINAMVLNAGDATGTL